MLQVIKYTVVIKTITSLVDNFSQKENLAVRVGTRFSSSRSYFKTIVDNNTYFLVRLQVSGI